jgi:hypothetical protein
MRMFLFWLLIHSVIRWTAAAMFWFAALGLPPHTGGDASARARELRSPPQCRMRECVAVSPLFRMWAQLPPSLSIAARVARDARGHRAVTRGNRRVQADDGIPARPAGIRDRSCCGALQRRRGRAFKYAVADEGRCASQGPLGVQIAPTRYRNESLNNPNFLRQPIMGKTAEIGRG